MTSQVAILRTRPETVLEDYGRLMRLVKYDQTIGRDRDLILKLNLSWTKYFPACSSQPWQLDGVVRTLLADGYDRARIVPVENKTVVTEVMVDLLLMQRELHPGVFAVMDGTVMGDGAGPRTMIPTVGNLILASADQVAIDAIAARIMGFDPLAIPYLRMCHERGLGVADPKAIELVGDADAGRIDMGFSSRRSLVIWGDQLIRRGPLRPLKRLLLHSPLVVWAPFASNVYHDWLWYPTVGRARIRAFDATPWGRLFASY